MFDGFKISIEVQSTFQSLLKNPRLEPIEHTSTSTGVINHTIDYKNLNIELFSSGRIQVTGSLHKYYNDGLHNWNDFTVSNLRDVLNRLNTELDINPLKASINNLEFGVNVNTPFAPNGLINSLLCFKWKPFNVMRTIGPGMGKECKAFNQYFIKIYNKGLQYDQCQNILRIEKKVVRMFSLKFGQLNLAALLNPDLWEHCKKELIKMVDDILINEPLNINSLSKNEQRIYNKVVNQSNWISFSRDQKKRYKKAFNNIISKYGKEQYRPIIIRLINEKFDQLINS